MHAHRSALFSLQKAKPTDLLSATETSPRQAGVGFDDPCKPDTDAGVCCFHSRLPSAPRLCKPEAHSAWWSSKPPQAAELCAQPSSHGARNASVRWAWAPHGWCHWMFCRHPEASPAPHTMSMLLINEGLLKQFTRPMLCQELGIAIYLVSLSVPCYITTWEDFCLKEMTFREVIPTLLLVQQKQTNTNAAV